MYIGWRKETEIRVISMHKHQRGKRKIILKNIKEKMGRWWRGSKV
jgi:hypothetical protein